MEQIKLQNSYYTYQMRITDDGHLEHFCFLPAGYERFPAEREYKRIYPYEVTLSFAESNHLGWRFGDAMLWDEASHDLIFDSYTTQDELTVIHMRHPRFAIDVQLCYLCRADSPALQRYTRIVNLGETAITLQHISSFMLCGFPYFGTSDDLYLHSYTSGWSIEGDQSINTFSSLGLLAPGCRSAWTFNNNSAFSTQKKFPYFVIEERSSNLFWGVQIESGSQWRAELGGGDVANPHWFYLQGGLLNFTGAQWEKLLGPGEVLETPKASLTVAAGCIDNIYNQLHTHQRKYFITQPDNDKNLPVIFNDWQAMRGNTSQERIHNQLDCLRELGIEIYVTDSGWYTEPGQDWSAYVGCWQSSRTRFPNGLGAVSSDIKHHGMIPGIWCEIEMAGPHSPHYNNANMLLTCHGQFITQGPRRFLDFRKEAVRKYAADVIGSLYGNGFRYIKIDYNADCSPGCDGPEISIVENLRQARLAYASWLEDILKLYPDLILEHCASGGMKLDYDNLTRGSLASITDQWNYLHTGSILCNVTRLIHPVQCENWSTLKADMDQNTMEFTLSNSMMGRFCISGIVSEFNNAQKQVIKQAIGFYKRNRELIKNPEIYYHTPPCNILDSNNLKVMEYLNSDTSMLYISGHDYAGSYSCSPKLGNFEITDAYPNLNSITVTDSSLCIQMQENQILGRILILKKK